MSEATTFRDNAFFIFPETSIKMINGSTDTNKKETVLFSLLLLVYFKK